MMSLVPTSGWQKYWMLVWQQEEIYLTFTNNPCKYLLNGQYTVGIVDRFL